MISYWELKFGTQSEIWVIYKEDFEQLVVWIKNDSLDILDDEDDNYGEYDLYGRFVNILET